MDPQETSEIVIKFLPTGDKLVRGFIKNAQILAHKLNWKRGGGLRKCPQGNMKRLGAKKGAGRIKHFFDKVTKENKYDINREHRKMNILAKKIVRKHFRQAYIEAKQWNCSILNAWAEVMVCHQR